MPDPDVITSWLRSRAIRLETLDAGGGRDDLASLAHTWDGLEVLGLGESTHGTREFFTLKHRLLEFLVLELGLRVVAMETSESAATVVDDYVRTGAGDAAAALAGLQFWTWNTREVLAMIKWLRRHNQQVPAERRVRFVGIDPQRPKTAVETVRAYLRDRAPTELERFSVVLQELDRNRPDDPPMRSDIVPQIEELIALLDEETASAVIENVDRERAIARRHAGFLLRSAQLFAASRSGTDGDSVYAVRDRLMAEATVDAVQSVADRQGLPVAVWAHNGHLSRGASSSAVAPMGSHLEVRFGRGYYALGLTLGAGRFHARHKRLLRGTTPTPAVHRIRAPSLTLVEGRLTAAVSADHIVDLRAPDAPEPVTAWLSQRSWTRSHGAVVSFLHRMAFTPMIPGRDFDGLACIHRTNPPTPC
ncbi:erythromycin esterase family protein [Amycolatopsis sp. cmx-11-32]|uniref:erythromycin esterase family protein n=1 Tax=Amycolatopsis sp. cmx-11-32 TaxID=2785796 RepID=UPI0039E2F8C5